MAIQEYKCPCCGGAIAFDSTLQKMKCPYCDTEFEMETLAAYDESLNAGSEDKMDWETEAGSEWQPGETEGMRVYVCKSCGGEIVGDASTAATSCPYCGNPIVMMGQFKGDLKPDLVIPFKLDKKAAKESLMNHLKGKPFLPKVFSDQNHIDEIKGVYVPFWLFDADVHGAMHYKATKVRTYADQDYNYREINYYSVFREGDLSFANVPVDGSTKMDDQLMESIEPFDPSEAVDFQTAYLAGYFADKYDVTSEESVGRANERIQSTTESAFAATVLGYSGYQKENGSIELKHGTAKYALYPVWMLTTSWNGEKYTFAMNGQTGKFVGDLPIDKGAVTRWFLGLFGGISAGVFLIQLLANLL